MSLLCAPQRNLRQEHILYPRCLSWLLEGKLVIESGLVRVKDSNALQLVFSAQP